MLDSLKVALQFLTRIPVELPEQVSERVQGRALLWYPVVGVLYGVLLVSLGIIFNHLLPMGLSVTESFVVSGLVLLVWVLLSGALHLDGLGDSADAWLGGGNDPERTLGIMKDVHAGTGALVAVFLVLMLKLLALLHLLLNEHYIALFLAPILARSSMLLLFATTPYVRKGGLGSLFLTHCRPRELWLVVAMVVVAVILFFKLKGMVLLLSALLMFYVCRRLMLKRIGGATGDTAGALLEVMELSVLMAGVFLP
ncbi:adenosylcobinamide-GDP ribazoletransferase [Aestuariirhabdus sp. Z084]|uniref:adenosylcobinamide-GDP ribazoletransferase n=1 Tax=Aestuariirhabdus haliotis TaxID=2918751 RepID=UPI00201B428B|nr:adenosylcobinamide-GDP ribazoletransferase [Aestuariirhabdus haliotis]MCL6414733.1 adenosylcobinamide-GDP ribazoletransferase [Aestuariirhabdus haliotis]MCL6418665.1 adenosylcobinamide-GDP ribazoletransferase [Aestuariirhabdus haliotis]